MTTPLVTTVVGSYPQPEWLIDRECLGERLPPRVRAQELWRVEEPFLEEAQDDATRLAVSDMERAGIDVEVRVPAFGVWFAAVAATVRPDGIFLSTFREVPSGTRVEVEIALPDGPPVHVSGIVSEHPLDGVGIDVAWAEIEPETRARIEALVSRLPVAPESGVRVV